MRGPEQHFHSNFPSLTSHETEIYLTLRINAYLTDQLVTPVLTFFSSITSRNKSQNNCLESHFCGNGSLKWSISISKRKVDGKNDGTIWGESLIYCDIKETTSVFHTHSNENDRTIICQFYWISISLDSSQLIKFWNLFAIVWKTKAM